MKRARVERPSVGPSGPRERIVPPAAAARLREAVTAAAAARTRADELAHITLEAMGCELGKPGDALIWNVVDGEDGSMIARYGPRMSVATASAAAPPVELAPPATAATAD